MQSRKPHSSSLDGPREAHVGYYLFGEGRPAFERLLGYRPEWRPWLIAVVRANARSLYFAAMILVTIILLGLLVRYGKPKLPRASGTGESFL